MRKLQVDWPVERTIWVAEPDDMDWAANLPKGLAELLVPEHLRSWDTPWPEYYSQAPAWIEARVLREAERYGWAPPWQRPAEPVNYYHIDGRLVRCDTDGRPLNPGGRSGRNVLSGGYWRLGPNWAADAAVVACRRSHWFVLLMQRWHGGRWAIPGGMCDLGELPSATAPRELGEETGFRLRPTDQWTLIRSTKIGSGQAHAWTEGNLYVCRVEPSRMDLPLKPQPGEAREAKWLPLNQALLAGLPLHGGHRELLTCLWAHVQTLPVD